jgi:hypothetical protein
MIRATVAQGSSLQIFSEEGGQVVTINLRVKLIITT